MRRPDRRTTPTPPPASHCRQGLSCPEAGRCVRLLNIAEESIMRRSTAFGVVFAATASAVLWLGMGGCPGGAGGAGGGTGVGGAFNVAPTPIITSDRTRGVAPLDIQFSSDRSTDDGLIISRTWD